MPEQIGEVERAVEVAIDEVNEAHELGDIPVDANGDRDFTREMALLELNDEAVDESMNFSELRTAVDAEVARQLDE